MSSRAKSCQVVSTGETTLNIDATLNGGFGPFGWSKLRGSYVISTETTMPAQIAMHPLYREFRRIPSQSGRLGVRLGLVMVK